VPDDDRAKHWPENMIDEMGINRNSQALNPGYNSN